MSKTLRWGVILGIILVLTVICVDLITVRHVLPRILIQPSPRALARGFVDAITSGDLELAISLTDGSPACIANMTRTFERYSPRYHDVPVDEIILALYFWYEDDPAHETIDFTFSDRDNWLATAGVATLRAHYEPLGKRYTCGVQFSD